MANIEKKAAFPATLSGSLCVANYSNNKNLVINTSDSNRMKFTIKPTEHKTVDNSVWNRTGRLKILSAPLYSFVLLLFFMCVSSGTLLGQLRPLFPAGEINASVACQLRFLSDYPAGDIPDSRRISPTAYNSEGQQVLPYFYVIPTVHLPEALSNNSAIRHYAIPSTLFFDDLTNVIIIAPNQPFSYNTSYSVVFNNFPLLEPNIFNNLGYTEIQVSSVFENYITTITAPLSITEVSFQKTGNVIWNLNEDIVLHLSKPIAPKLEFLDSMFTLIKVGNATNVPEQGLSYDFITIPTTAELSSDGKSITVSHSTPFEPGASYFFNVNWEYYLGDDFFNTSFSFSVPDRIIADIKVHFPNGILPGEFNYKGYDGQKLYYYGDTIRLGFPAIYKNYYLSEWKLPETTEGTLYHYGEFLEIILDSDNYFSNAHANSVFNGIKKTGITIDVYYSENPIDTLRISFDIADSLASQYPNYYEDILVEGGIESKIDDTTYTYMRYSTASVYISSASSAGLNASFVALPTNTSSVSIPTNYLFPSNAISTLPGGMLNNGNRCTTIVTQFDPRQNMGCELGKFKVELHYQGTKRSFDNWVYANIHDMISKIEFTDYKDDKYYPKFADSAKGEMAKTSLEMSIPDNNRTSVFQPINVRYTVELSHPDYEIFWVTTKYGNHYRTVDNPCLEYGFKKWQEYVCVDISSVSGIIRTDGYNKCENILIVHIRRKVVEFAFDVINPKDNRAPDLAYFRLEFEGLPPTSSPVRYPGDPPITNYPDTTFDNSGVPALNYNWGYFLGRDYNIAHDEHYLRRAVKKKNCPIVAGRENVLMERVSVFYYSGESFTYKPLVRGAYKFVKMTFPTNPNYDCIPVNCDPDAPEQKVRITNFKKPDKITFQSREGFILEYIEVPQLRGDKDEDPRGNANWTYKGYAVCEYGNTEYGFPIWRPGVLDGYDNGAYLNEERGGINHLHERTVKIIFQFNKDVYPPSMESNITIYDYVGDPPYDKLRPDSNYLTDYPIIFDGFGGTGGNAWYSGGVRGCIVVSFRNPNKPTNKNGPYKICNLQLFNIDIINSPANPILGGNDIYDIEDLEPLENLKSSLTRPKTTFTGSTIPPGLAIETMYFANLTYQHYFLMNLWSPDVYIGNWVLDVTDESPMPLAAEIYTRDTAGRVMYNEKVRRFPSSSLYKNFAHSTKKWVTFPTYLNKILKADQNILNLYHWMDDLYTACNTYVTTGTNITNVATRIYAAIKTGGISEIPIGKDSIYVRPDGTRDTVKKAINLSTTSVDAIVDGLGSVIRGLCPSDKEMGYTNFWLARTGLNLDFNCRYKILDDDGRLIIAKATSAAEAEQWYEENIKQDWRIWGVGSYGMYDNSVIRDAYDINFGIVKVVRLLCGLRPVFSVDPRFYTRIKLRTGDNR